MNATTTATTAPALVGNGRTVHEVPAGETATLCGSTATTFLTAAEANAKKGKACAKCTKIAALRAAEAAAKAPAPEEAPAAPAEQEPAEVARAVEATPVWRTLKGAGDNGAFTIYGDLHEGHGKLVFTSWGTAKQLKGQPHTFTRQWSENRGFNRYLEDVQGRRVEFNGGTATRVWMIDGVPVPAAEVPVDEPQAAAAEQAPEVDEAPAEPAEAEQAPETEDTPAEPAEVEADDAPAEEVDTDETAAADLVQVTAYTAARQALRINGKDSDDTTLTLPAADLLETVAAMRRMPRWNDEQERLVINKVALIVASSAEGQRVWVRGEAAPIRVDLAGNPIAEDAPAEPGTVDGAALLAATRVLRRRAEVQRVIDNRTAARAASAAPKSA
ncbi:hypothetical protein [Streptomyces tendae]|uniref:hypothetical protein n=1 Tax=Streptomyces tendae TaxID=1932 RepID=UPI003417FCBC